jgi:hypothetical protein
MKIREISPKKPKNERKIREKSQSKPKRTQCSVAEVSSFGVAPSSAACGWSVILANARIQILLLEAGSWPLEAVPQKQTQFFHDQICVINIKNAETEAKKLGKKTKQTQLWITLNVRLHWTL